MINYQRIFLQISWRAATLQLHPLSLNATSGLNIQQLYHIIISSSQICYFFSSVSIKNFSVYRLYLCSIFIHIFMQQIAYLSVYIISFPLYNLNVFDLPMLLLLHYYPALPYQFPPLSSFYLYPSLLSLYFLICHYYYCNLNLIILSFIISASLYLSLAINKIKTNF